MTLLMYSFPERKISAIFLWQTVVLKNMLRDGSSLSRGNFVCKVIRYIVFPMHKLKLRLGYLKELKFSVLSQILVWKLLWMKKKSAAMPFGPFGSEVPLSQLLVQTQFFGLAPQRLELVRWNYSLSKGQAEFLNFIPPCKSMSERKF